MVRLSIIIVSWNTRQVLLDCLASIGRYPPSGLFEVLVIDNASTDDSAESIRRHHPHVLLIANDQNRGFAAANNQAIARARGQYLLLLNPDTIVHPHSLDILCEFMEHHEEVTACGPRLLNEDGTLQPSARRFPTFRGALHRYTALRYFGIFRGHYRRWLMKDFAHDRQMDVDQLMGSALLVRRSAVEQVGRMDEQFFVYYEEVDLCCRLKQAGGRIVFVPDAIITHLGARSSRQVPVGRRVMMLESLLRYFRKHRGRLATALFNGMFKPGVLLRVFCQALGNALIYICALLTRNPKRRAKSAGVIRDSAVLLAKHSWRLLLRA